MPSRRAHLPRSVLPFDTARSLIDGLAGQGAAEASVETDHPSELVRNAFGKVFMIKGMKSKPSTTPPAP